MVCRVNGLAYCLSRISTWQGASPYGVPLGRPVGLLTAAGNSIGPLFWYPIPVRIGSPTGDAWLTCQCASQSACSAFHNIRRLSLPSLVGEGTSHCAICWLRLLSEGCCLRPLYRFPPPRQKYAADFFANAAGLSDEPSPQQPSAMDTSPDPPSSKDGTLER